MIKNNNKHIFGGDLIEYNGYKLKWNENRECSVLCLFCFCGSVFCVWFPISIIILSFVSIICSHLQWNLVYRQLNLVFTILLLLYRRGFVRYYELAAVISIWQIHFVIGVETIERPVPIAYCSYLSYIIISLWTVHCSLFTIQMGNRNEDKTRLEMKTNERNDKMQ